MKKEFMVNFTTPYGKYGVLTLFVEADNEEQAQEKAKKRELYS